VDEQDVLIVRGLWLEKVCGSSDPAGNQPVTNAPVFFGRKDVVADGKVVGVTIYELERQHFV
jgi:hypothetical protein